MHILPVYEKEAVSNTQHLARLLANFLYPFGNIETFAINIKRYGNGEKPTAIDFGETVDGKFQAILGECSEYSLCDMTDDEIIDFELGQLDENDGDIKVSAIFDVFVDGKLYRKAKK